MPPPTSEKDGPLQPTAEGEKTAPSMRIAKEMPWSRGYPGSLLDESLSRAQMLNRADLLTPMGQGHTPNGRSLVCLWNLGREASLILDLHLFSLINIYKYICGHFSWKYDTELAGFLRKIQVVNRGKALQGFIVWLAHSGSQRVDDWKLLAKLKLVTCDLSNVVMKNSY